MASLVLNIMHWRNHKASRPRDPPFEPPFDTSSDARGEARPVSSHDHEDDDEDEESQYGQVPQLNDNNPNSPFSDANRANAARPYSDYSSASATTGPRASVDNYGAFNDPVPSGYGGASFGQASGLAGAASPAGVSRTMQYADPYAAVRASIAGTSAGSAGTPAGPVPAGGAAGSRPNSGVGPFVPALPYVPSVSPFAAPQPPSYEYSGYKG